MPNVLALDTSALGCSVALLSESGFFTRSLMTQRHSAQNILPLLSEVLVESGASLGTVDVIAIMAGPGSFTGIRIGMGVAQGLSMAHGTPLLPLSCLAVKAYMALCAQSATHVLVSEVARDDEVYFGAYAQSALRGVELLGTEQVASPDNLVMAAEHAALSREWLAAGNGWSEAHNLQARLGVQGVSGMIAPPFCGRSLCDLASLRFANQEAVAADLACPNYVKETMHYSR